MTGLCGVDLGAWGRQRLRRDRGRKRRAVDSSCPILRTPRDGVSSISRRKVSSLAATKARRALERLCGTRNNFTRGRELWPSPREGRPIHRSVDWGRQGHLACTGRSRSRCSRPRRPLSAPCLSLPLVEASVRFGRGPDVDRTAGERPQQSLSMACGDDRSAVASSRTLHQPPKRRLPAFANWRARPATASTPQSTCAS